MATVSLDLVKRYVRADDFSEDDSLLASLLESAEDYALTYVSRDSDELLELGAGSYPPSFVLAVLLLVGHWYNQREAAASVQVQAVPYGVDALLKPLRRLYTETTEDSAEEGEGGA